MFEHAVLIYDESFSVKILCFYFYCGKEEGNDKVVYTKLMPIKYDYKDDQNTYSEMRHNKTK